MEFFSPPNSVTLLRVLLTPVFAFLFLESDFNSAFYALLIFAFASITDWYDGWIARKLKSTSAIGNFFDPLADKILTSTAFILFSIKNYMPWYLTLIIVFRDAIITIIRMLFDANGKNFNTSFFAKTKTFLQMIAIYYLLLFHLVKSSDSLNEFFYSFTFLFSPNIIYASLLIVTAITFWTGVVYLNSNFETIKFILNDLKKKNDFTFTERIFATVFFAGYFPFAQGTVSSFVALIIFYFLVNYIGLYFIFLILILFFIGIKLANKFENILGHDPKNFTLDELVAMWMVLIFLPISFKIFLIAFIIFRIFDIFKPFPISHFDQLNGGKAIMMDDIFAAIYSIFSIKLILIIFPNLK